MFLRGQRPLEDRGPAPTPNCKERSTRGRDWMASPAPCPAVRPPTRSPYGRGRGHRTCKERPLVPARLVPVAHCLECVLFLISGTDPKHTIASYSDIEDYRRPGQPQKSCALTLSSMKPAGVLLETARATRSKQWSAFTTPKGLELLNLVSVWVQGDIWRSVLFSS